MLPRTVGPLRPPDRVALRSVRRPGPGRPDPPRPDARPGLKPRPPPARRGRRPAATSAAAIAGHQQRARLAQTGRGVLRSAIPYGGIRPERGAIGRRRLRERLRRRERRGPAGGAAGSGRADERLRGANRIAGMSGWLSAFASVARRGPHTGATNATAPLET